MKIKIKNPIFGVPITIVDKIADDGFIHCSRNEEDIKFEIVTFRKGNDGQDLVFTRERERKSSTLLSHPSSTNIPGMIKNAEGKVNGKITYARMLLQKVK